MWDLQYESVSNIARSSTDIPDDADNIEIPEAYTDLPWALIILETVPGPRRTPLVIGPLHDDNSISLRRQALGPIWSPDRTSGYVYLDSTRNT